MVNPKVPISTPPKTIRALSKVHNGKETDGTIHYDIYKPVTDADIVYFYDYQKYEEVVPIAATDSVETAIEKLDRKDDYLKELVDKAQATADLAVQKADAAQATANTARSEAQAAQQTANTAVQKADAAQAAANAAQSAANAARAAADAAKDAADNAQQTAGDSGGDVDLDFEFYGFNFSNWIVMPGAGGSTYVYASFTFSWKISSTITSISTNGLTFQTFIKQIPYNGNGSGEISVFKNTGDWTSSLRNAQTKNLTFTAHGNGQTRSKTYTVTIPAYAGQSQNSLPSLPETRSVKVGNDWG